MIVIKSLEALSFDQLYQAFSTAFVDYEMQLTFEQFQRMILRRGFVSELSFGAFDNDVLVSFTLNGIGMHQGVKTAYDTGTGTVKAYRGQGLASQIFQHSIPFLREAGIKQYLLEVLKHNAAAVSVYRKQGFSVTREFSYFTSGKEITSNKPKLQNFLYMCIENSAISQYHSWFDFEPSWQNSFDAITRQPESFIVKTAVLGQQTVGYCIFEPAAGDITQIAVHPDFRRKGIATALLLELIKENIYPGMKLINTDNRFPAINYWAESVGLEKRGEQFEMTLQLDHD